MFEDAEVARDLVSLVVPQRGALVATGERQEPFRLVDGDGRVVAAAAGFFCDLQAAGRPDSTVRSYGLDLLRWFRFLWAAGVSWERATRTEARDFCRWMIVAGKPARGQGAGAPYSVAVRAHAETVLQGFYGFHRPWWLIRHETSASSRRARWLVRVRSSGWPFRQAWSRIRLSAVAAVACSSRVLSRPR